MQLALPIFPHDITLINASVGVYTREEIVTYIVNGLPMYNHATENLNGFRFFTSNLIVQGRCKKTEIARCFGVSYDSVNRYAELYREKGEDVFFGSENRHGHSYKLISPVLEKAQRYLDAGKSNSETARLISVSEGAIRYALKNGVLKKSAFLT